MPALLDEIDLYTKPREGCKSWIDRVRREDPPLHREITDVVNRFLSGDEAVVSRLPTVNAVGVFLSGAMKRRGRPVSCYSISKSIHKLRCEKNDALSD